MKYLKVFVDFAEAQEALNDAEFGRLIRAMVKYVSDGSKPDLRGNERYAWGSAKLSIDQQSGSYNNKVAGAAKAREKRTDIKSNQNDIKEKILISTQEQEQDKEHIKEIPSNEGTKKSRAFQPPTLEEVKARCAEKGYTLDPEAFIAYYNANGWKVGRTKMVSWIDALAGWESREKQYRKPKQNAALKYEQKPINQTDFDALVVNLGEEDK
jgi:hypothetical protein